MVAAQGRPQVGVAFGGGSARGLAHVGVIRWLEEHHIPIDVAAGTSVGGLIGGSFATGMNAAELEAMLDTLDWSGLFGSFNFQFKNIRRKADARAFPSRLEFGLKRGPAAPTALNNGQQVDRLIDRLTAPYYATASFDDLPTPFRAVAVDLRTAKMVVMDHGSLARAIRATVSYPGLFPPVESGDQVLVDGGALNNLPADVVRSMGASVVIAVNVSDLDDLKNVDYSMFGVMAETLDAMIRANSKTALAAADVLVNVPVVAAIRRVRLAEEPADRGSRLPGGGGDARQAAALCHRPGGMGSLARAAKAFAKNHAAAPGICRLRRDRELG